jgi:hypothetical protein
MHPTITSSNSLHSHKRIKIYIPLIMLLVPAFVVGMKYSNIKKACVHDPKIVVFWVGRTPVIHKTMISLTENGFIGTYRATMKLI